jgi:hypothetical protein
MFKNGSEESNFSLGLNFPPTQRGVITLLVCKPLYFLGVKENRLGIVAYSLCSQVVKQNWVRK